MANAKIDDNREKTAIVVDGAGTIKNLLVDATTGRLLLECYIGANATVNKVKVDENREWISQGVDETTGNPVPLHVETATNYLKIDLLIE